MITEWLAKTFYGAGDLQTESDRLDAARQEENLRDRERYGEDWYQQTLANDAAGRIDAAAEIGAEFQPNALGQNLRESASAAGKAVGSAAGNVVQAAGNFLGNTLLGFPAWFWAVFLLGGFFYFGGGNLIRAWVARKAR